MRIFTAPIAADRTTWLTTEFLKDPKALVLLQTEMARTNFVAAIPRITSDQSNRVRTFDEFLQGRLMGLEPSTIFIDGIEAFFAKQIGSLITRKPGIEIAATCYAEVARPAAIESEARTTVAASRGQERPTRTTTKSA